MQPEDREDRDDKYKEEDDVGEMRDRGQEGIDQPLQALNNGDRA